MTTWCGQPDELALHWTPENCQRLGNVLWLIKTGKAEDREKAFQEFLDLKRMFILEEFEEYLHRLDDFRAQLGQPTLSELIEQIKAERVPSSNWKALAGPVVESAMLPEMKTAEYTIDPCDFGKCDVNRCANADKYLDDGVCRTKVHVPVALPEREGFKRCLATAKTREMEAITEYYTVASKVAVEILNTDYYSFFIKIIRRCK